MAELRIGILGSGYMGRTHAECITRHVTRARLVAVAGGRRAPALAADYGVAVEPDFPALLARPDIDAVLIATPHADHCAQVIEAARAGKHVLVEKPMATSVADCTAMIAACAAAGVRLEVIQTQRFRGAISRTRDLVASGAIGGPRMFQGRSLFTDYVVDTSPWAGKEEHGGAFLDTAVHIFDLMRVVLGSEATRIFANLHTFGAAPDRVVLRFNSKIEHGLSRATIEPVGGRPVALTAASSPEDRSAPDRLVIPLRPLGPGTYVVRYRVLAADGHLTEGALRFTIRAHP